MAKKSRKKDAPNTGVLVVGNGPSVAKHAFGRLIDTFPEVFRINRYRLSKFEAKVGTKTTVWVRSHAYRTAPAPGPGIAILDVVLATSQKRKTPTIRRSMPKIEWPSVGLCVLAHLIAQGIHPYVIGFDAYRKGQQRNYWSEDPIAESDPHDPAAEEEYLVAWAERREIIILEREIERGAVEL